MIKEVLSQLSPAPIPQILISKKNQTIFLKGVASESGTVFIDFNSKQQSQFPYYKIAIPMPENIESICKMYSPKVSVID